MNGSERHLLLESSRGRYLLPAQRVQEIAWLPLLSDPPTDRPAQVGTVNIRGRSAPVLDLDAALGRRPEPYSLEHRLVAVTASDGLLAVVVPRVRDVVDVAPAQVDPADGDAAGPVTGTVRLGDDVAGLLDPDALADLPAAPEGATLDDPMAGFDEAALEMLEDRKRDLATAPDAAAAHEDRSAALVELGQELLAVPLDGVREFVEPDDLTPVPSTPSHILGLLNHRGELIPVVDLGGPLDVQGALDEGGGPVVVVDLETGPTGVAVDGIRGTVSVPDDAFDPSRRTAEHSLGSFVHEDRTVLVVDLASVLRSDRVTIQQEV